MPLFRPDIKPPMWGPIDAIAFAARSNAEREGLDPSKIIGYWPIFEVGGNKIFSLFGGDKETFALTSGDFEPNVVKNPVLTCTTSRAKEAHTKLSCVLLLSKMTLNEQNLITTRPSYNTLYGFTFYVITGTYLAVRYSSGGSYTTAQSFDMRGKSFTQPFMLGFSFDAGAFKFAHNENRASVSGAQSSMAVSASSLAMPMAAATLHGCLLTQQVVPDRVFDTFYYEPYKLLMPVARPLYFDMGGSENKTGVLAITNDSSLGLGGIKGALGSASFTASAAFSPSGIKAANGYVSFSSASEFGVSGILEQSDDKIGAVVFVNESIVGASGAKNALGGFGISHAAEVGASGVKGVLMPELSQASGAAVSSSEISGSVYTNKNTGILYAVATLSSTKPSVAQIQAGQNHLGAAAPYATSQAVSTYGLQSVAADGLTFNTPYYWHFQHKDGDNIDSTVITSAAVQTLDATVTLDFPAAAPCSLLGYQVWSKLAVTDEEIAALWSE